VALVRDFGPRVPENMLATIFPPFHRIGDSDGAGLGLTIAEQAVRVHGGGIRASNAPDGGLIVQIDLPLTLL
jgi:two-component system, OmpR family, sensor histidine kinase CpxA